MRALIIDDSRAMRAIIVRILKDLGITDCVEAANGKEGLEALAAKGPFQLAMVDWHTPVMNGYEFLVAARALPAHAGMKIVMCTTETEVGHLNKALVAGADEYVMKPFTKDGLLSKLQLLGLLGV